MAKKLTPSVPPPTSGRPWAFWLALSGAGLTVAGGSAWLWREWSHTQALRKALPSAPAAEAGLEALAVRLRAAEEAARKDPRDTLAVAELGRLYHANGYNRQALACWEILRSLEPDEPRWTYYAADLHRTASQYPAMLEALERTLALDPRQASAHLQLAEYFLKTGDLARAEVNYQQRLALLSEDPYAQLGLARCAFLQGRVREASALLAHLVRTSPGFPSAHNFYAEVLASQGDQAKAEEQRREGRAAGRFREAEDKWLLELRTWCLDAKRLIAIGTVEYQNNEFERAKELFERASGLEPNNLRLLEILGDLYQKMGQLDRARASLQQYLDRAGDKVAPPMVYVNLSEVLRALGRPQESLAVVDDGLRRGGNVPELVNARGVALTELDRVDEAIASFRQALALDALDTEANYNLGALLLDLGQREVALDHLKQSLVRKSRYLPTLKLLVRFYLDQGALAEAEVPLRMLWESQPKLPFAVEAMSFWNFRSGAAAENAGDLVKAEANYREGLRFLPTSKELNRALGALLLITDRPDQAVAPLEALVRETPEDAQAKMFLGQAYFRTERVPEAVRLLREALSRAEKTGQTGTAEICREILQALGAR